MSFRENIRAGANIFIAAISAVLLAAAPCRSAGASYGILLMAHGGDQNWNKEIATIGRSLDAQAPTEVALGMADAAALQKAVKKLEARHVGKIVAVPLFINSHSEVMDQTRYVLGINDKPSLVLKEALARIPHEMMPPGHHHMYSEDRVETWLPVVLTPALDDDRAVSEVLFDRAKALSKDPRSETVVLVGHGPVDDRAAERWLKTMDHLSIDVAGMGRFKDAKFAMIRDDSPRAVKDKAAGALRKIVKDASRDGGRAIVLPYLVARGGIEEHITAILKGLDYAWDGETLCPHPAIARWAGEVASRGAKMDNMRRFK